MLHLSMMWHTMFLTKIPIYFYLLEKKKTVTSAFSSFRDFCRNPLGRGCFLISVGGLNYANKHNSFFCHYFCKQIIAHRQQRYFYQFIIGSMEVLTLCSKLYLLFFLSVIGVVGLDLDWAAAQNVSPLNNARCIFVPSSSWNS